MDPSTPPAQDVQNQTVVQPINRAQPPTANPANNGTPQATSTQPQPEPSIQKPNTPKTSVSVGNIESEGVTAIAQEAPDSDADDEDEIKVAPQETKNSVVSQGGNLQEGEVELQPAVPEMPSTSVEVEKFVEKSPDLEKPDIPKVASDAGVTHSGPGVIVAPQNTFGVKKMPAITYQQAAVQVKKTKLHDSKHWFLGMMMYIWRKLNPQIDGEGEEKKDDQEIDNAAIPLQKPSSQEGEKEV